MKITLPFSLATLAVSFGVFMGASATFAPLNVAASIAGGLVALGASTFVALSMTGREWRSSTGLSVFRPAHVAMAVLLGVANALSLSNWLGWLSSKLFPQVILDLFDTGRLLASAMTNPLEQTAVLLAVVVLAPVAEELLFRGVFFRGLNERLGVIASAVLSGFIFSAYHLDPVGFLPRFEIGIVLALLVWKSGSLWPCIAVHAANNALSMMLTAAQIQDSDLPWWVGVVSLVALLASGAWFWTRPTAPPPEVLQRAPVSLFRAAGPWVLPLAVSAVLIATLDARGGQLTRIDLSAPLLGKGDEAEEAALVVLRAQARRGDASCEDYGTRRRALSKARIGALVQQWLPKARSRPPKSGQPETPVVPTEAPGRQSP
ncbi:MAG: type II CAAX endopeptidase family protein [Myxococcales bacterium]|nr:type II CAAX endopeptidase family protein [Myxococcales bacterium]